MSRVQVPLLTPFESPCTAGAFVMFRLGVQDGCHENDDAWTLASPPHRLPGRVRGSAAGERPLASAVDLSGRWGVAPLLPHGGRPHLQRGRSTRSSSPCASRTARAATSSAQDAKAAGAKVTLAVSEPIAAGTYSVLYRVVSADSHPISGSTKFTVAGNPQAPPATTGTASGRGHPHPVRQLVGAQPSGGLGGHR